MCRSSRQKIDNPWMNAKALALKTGAVLGTLLSERAFGNRPITLVGYSLGSLVIFEALQHLSRLSPAAAADVVQDVFLFGLPAPTDQTTWTAIRRVVAGRLVNGYSTDDYILAVLSRASSASWGIAGMTKVEVQGVENVQCTGVDGHLKWRGMIGQCLQQCEAPGILGEEVKAQMRKVAARLEREMEAEADSEEKRRAR